MGSHFNPGSDSPPTPGRIGLLPDALVDQIAAGEVVERPASIVKELVENSLDAGARQVSVEVRDGGVTWIAVTDDGHGMSPGDARLAVQRHATSKMRTIEDLSAIGSFGFRGEALPAIASVSRFRLITAPPGTPEAFELLIEGGRLLREGAVGAPAGTRIEVADLFASVPARRKFLKRASTEWGHIADWIGRLGLSLPGVHFELRRDDRVPTIWPATDDRLERVAAVLSEGDAAALVAADQNRGGVQVSVLVSAPERSRANASGLYTFVNGRPVRDPLMRQAVLTAYRDVLPRGRFPVGLVFVSLPAEAVDVNVHPAKWEVRFADPKAIHQLIRHTVRDAMASRSWLQSPAVPFDADVARFASAEPLGSAGESSTRDGPVPSLFDEGGARMRPGGASDSQVRERAQHEARLSFAALPLVGQLHASYLLVESAGGLLLVDQHAAHERILYERLREQWLAAGVERQGLLAPVPAELPADAVRALMEGAEAVSRLGFDIEEFGDGAVLVRSVPALLAGRDPVALIQGLAEELDSSEGQGGGSDETRLLAAADRIFATIACHSARRFGDRLPVEEQQAILTGLDAIPWAPTCPHGRPVAIALDREEIERRFARR